MSLGPRPLYSCSKRADPFADRGLDFALGLHRAGNSETVARICSTFPKSPGLTRW